MATMDHKETTKHLRKRIKVAGIKARVAKYDSCGQAWIRVCVPGPEVRFSEDEQRQIRHIAKCNHLTRACRSEIDVERMTDPMDMHFEYHQGA